MTHLRLIKGGRVDAEQWMRFAACKGTPPNMFFPEQGASNKAAKAMCARCPARVACLEYAIDNMFDTGIWGGTTPRERQKIRRQRRIGGAA